jgi:hypothetical protein
MSLTNRLSDSVQAILSAVSAAATANATSAWVDVRGYEGDVQLTINTGAITGTVTYTFQTATDSSGTGARTIVPNEGALTVVTTSNDDPNCQKATFEARNLDGFIKGTGTIVTGPALVAYSLTGRKKYTT